MATRIPKQKRSIAKYDAIIQTSIRIINEDKFQDCSTHTIAKEAGVGIGTVYDYFDSKDDILLSVLEHESTKMWQNIEDIRENWNALEPLEAIRQFFVLFTNHAYENAGFVKIAFGSIPGVMNTEPVKRHLALTENLFKTLLIKSGMNAPVEKLDTIAFILMNTIIGVMLGIARGLPPTVTRESITEEMIQGITSVLENGAAT